MQFEEEPSALTRIRESKDFGAMEALIMHLRRRAPYMVPANELATAIARPKRQIYGLVKLARKYLALTTGEFIPNKRGHGYWVDRRDRAGLFESIKSGDRADAHLRAEADCFNRVDRSRLTTPEDFELYVAQRGRIHMATARLGMSRDMSELMARRAKNLALTSAAKADASTPWDVLGLDDPNANRE